jgi:hypothetical protein
LEQRAEVRCGETTADHEVERNDQNVDATDLACSGK